ncbi:MAG TPA: ABC transporter substrate-binding protein [Reyranella sp.]|nr:ABC transporter substrate-binding protein [Reyranella sp.]
MVVQRRKLLAGTAALAAFPGIARSQAVKPRVTFISQWSSGSDGAAITGLGKRFEQEGGIWQHSPVPGFTTDMMNKLRAEIIAGNPPAASQLKGPEIAVWSKIAPTVNIDPLVEAAGYEKLIPSELIDLHKPQGHWIALPMQVYRTTTLFMSRPAMKKVGVTKAPKTWAEFNEIATAMKGAGITPVANGGMRWDDGMRLEIALSGISCDAYRAAIMNLDPKAMKGPEMIEALVQARKFQKWMDPNTAAQHYSVHLPAFLKGDMGMLMMGGWAQGVIKNLGGNLDDVLITSVPQNEGKPVFVLNADSMIFWKRKEPDLTAGQQLLAKLMMQKDVQEQYSQTTGSIPVRTDVDLSGSKWTDGQREASAVLNESFKSKRVLLSLAHNMAQTNPITAAMIDVITEYVHNDKVTPEQAAAQLVTAVDNARG